MLNNAVLGQRMQKAIRSGVSESYLVTDLKQLDRWLCWQGRRDETGVRKIPVNKVGGSWQRVSYRAPENHYSYSEATELYKQFKDEDGRSGIDGRQVVIEHRSDDFIIVDLDNCVDPDTGEIDRWAQKYVARGGTYTELSPSGEGLHLIFRGTIDRQGWAGPDDEFDGEVYKKYIISFTGDHIVGTPFRAKQNPKFLEWLFTENDIWWRELLYDTAEGDNVYGAPTVSDDGE